MVYPLLVFMHSSVNCLWVCELNNITSGYLESILFKLELTFVPGISPHPQFNIKG